MAPISEGAREVSDHCRVGMLCVRAPFSEGLHVGLYCPFLLLCATRMGLTFSEVEDEVPLALWRGRTVTGASNPFGACAVCPTLLGAFGVVTHVFHTTLSPFSR